MTTRRGNNARQLRLAAWRVMWALSFFTSEDVVAGSGMTGHSARALIRRLLKGGVIERAQARQVGQSGSREVYRLASGVSGIPREVDDAAYWQHQAWTAMRILRRFTASEVLRAMWPGAASLRSVGRWCRALAAEGYLRQHGEPVPGQENVYQLVRDEGPDLPVLSMERALVAQEVEGG